MNAIPLCRVSTFLPFLNFLNQLGSPTDRLLERARLPILALDHPDALMPLYQAFDFVEHAAQLEKMELLGIVVAQQTQIADLGLIGHLIHQSLTLYDLLQTLERAIPSVNSTERVWIEEADDRVWLHHHFTFPPTIQHRQARLYAVLLHLKAVQLAAGEAWQPLELRLNSGYSKKLTEIEAFANIPLHFNHPTDAIAIPKSLLSQPLRPSVSQLSSSQDCYHHLQTTAPSPSFAGSLRQLLQSMLQDGYPDIHIAAEATGISVRSFQRRLAEANLNYSHLVEQVRFDRAIELLNDPGIQLIDIALDLGYTDAANFTRAFKRWTGTSPREFRRLHVTR
ncbi:AraC family transcriptional regulator [Leptolyngbya sp. 7M]|uniref:AraC family transcriptional regulator n=1 Tax=Leptolyngbya sp. 7M TaxID=2812896 RepID=UPI001B8CEE5B|nr:AraC family transcriptional regulator [Leptolyngbya sp. 7M]QYO67892.1 AraC family transcriptional regulator [Leptolyngbya sp. 7M]